MAAAGSQWRCRSAESSAAVAAIAVVATSNLAAVDDIAGGRGRSSGARHPSVAGGGLRAGCWRQCRMSCRAQAGSATEMRCAMRLLTRTALAARMIYRRCSCTVGSRCRSASRVVTDQPVVGVVFKGPKWAT